MIGAAILAIAAHAPASAVADRPRCSFRGEILSGHRVAWANTAPPVAGLMNAIFAASGKRIRSWPLGGKFAKASAYARVAGGDLAPRPDPCAARPLYSAALAARGAGAPRALTSA
jgi:hypothetical protein